LNRQDVTRAAGTALASILLIRPTQAEDGDDAERIDVPKAAPLVTGQN
jgi:hypothetical protein